ncbi:hypothetical protein B0H10DRAFT_2063422 [Mycena sp. CBHHK59/15]|nr:hypothetical protein B0H10DRAFT_2063422 [Mycena sp. CBHHK59/15]
MSNNFAKLPPIFRFLITSRPDSDIADGFLLQSWVIKMHLDITMPLSTVDVLRYIRYRMEYIRKQQHRWNLDSRWPGDSSIQALANYSGGLFIWASTVPNLY